MGQVPVEAGGLRYRPSSGRSGEDVGPDATIENGSDSHQIDPNLARMGANSTPMAANSRVLFRFQLWGVFGGASTWTFSGRRRPESLGDNSFHRHGRSEQKGVGVMKCKK